MVHILLPLALAFGSTDQISMVHPHPDGKKPLRLEVHEPFNGWNLSDPAASDKKFFRSDGSRPVRFVFGADVDGDGYDEIVVIQQRMKKNDRYELRVHSAPKKLGKDVGKPLAIAGKAALGAPSTHGKIISAASIDGDGDGFDEFMLLRQSSDGVQRIEIRSLSLAKKPDVSVSASFDNVGQFPFDTVQEVTAIDLDGNGYEEIAMARGWKNLTTRLQVIRPPAFMDDSTSTPLLNAEMISSPILALDTTNLGSGIDSLLVLLPLQEGSLWMRYDDLLSVDLATLPVAAEVLAGTPEHFFVLHGPEANVNEPFFVEDLPGAYTGTFSHTIPVSYGLTIDDVLGPLDGISIDINESSSTLSLPGEQSLEGTFNSFFKEFTFSDEPVVIEVDDVVLTLTLFSAQATAFSEDITIEGFYTGTRTVGNFTVPIHTGKFVLSQK